MARRLRAGGAAECGAPLCNSASLQYPLDTPAVSRHEVSNGISDPIIEPINATALVPRFQGYGNKVEAGSDTLVASVSTLSLTAGKQTPRLPHGNPGAQVVFDTPGTFFILVTLRRDAKSQTPHWFRVTHLTESSVTGEDRSFDIPLLLEDAPDVSSRIALAASPGSDEDGLRDICETDTACTSRR